MYGLCVYADGRGEKRREMEPKRWRGLRDELGSRYDGCFPPHTM